MPLILIKTEENLICEILDKKKVYCNIKKLISTKYFKRPKRLKMGTLYGFRERKCI